MSPYSIQNIIKFRQLDWNYSEDFLFLTDIPSSFEPFTITPDYFSYGIISKGELVVKLDDELLHIDNKNRSFFVYRPEQNLEIIEISPGTEGAFVLFNKKFIQTLDHHYLSITEKTFLESRFSTYYTLIKSDYDRLRNLFSKIFDLLSFMDRAHWSQTAKHLMLVLISETDLVLNRYKSKSQMLQFKKGSKILETLMELIKEHYLQEQNLDFYAQQLSISVNYLHKIVHNSLNTTPSALIQDAILRHSIVLLENTEHNISEIAEKLSFNDVYSFSKFFKKKMLMAPTKYRNAFREDLIQN